MQIELLYFDGCPSWEGALENPKAALQAEGLQAEIHLVKVESDEEAARLKFLGSPSFRVDGVDWWPEERKRYNLSCRVYFDNVIFSYSCHCEERFLRRSNLLASQETASLCSQ